MDRDSLKLSLFATMLSHNQDVPAAIQDTRIVLEALFNDPRPEPTWDDVPFH